jgi:hypothetical protein
MCRPWAFVFFSFLTLVVLGVCIWKALQYNPTCDDYCKWGSLGGVCLFAYSVAWAVCKFEFAPNSIICAGQDTNYRDSVRIHTDVTSGFIVFLLELPCCFLCHIHNWIFNRIICCAPKPMETTLPTPLTAHTNQATAPLSHSGEPKAPCV